MAGIRPRHFLFIAIVTVTLSTAFAVSGTLLAWYWAAAISIAVIVLGFYVITSPALHRENTLNLLEQQMKPREEKIGKALERINNLQNNILLNEKKYRERVEDAVDSIYEIDGDGFYVYVNPESEKLTEYSRAELLKMHFTELIDKEFRPNVIAFYKEQTSSKVEKTYYEFPIRSRSGQRIWVGQTTRMIFRDGRMEKAYNVARDISDIHESKELLQKSESRFKLIAENSLVGIHEINAAAEITFMNRQWYEISGVPRPFTPEKIISAIHEDDRESTTNAWNTAIQERKKITLEFRFRHPQRGIVWVISATTPIISDSGELKGFIGTLTDITELKETYLKLAKSEETYRLISNNANDLITLYKNDANATRVFISPSSKNILGYEPEELIGRSPFEIILPEDATRMRASIHPDTLQGKPAHTEYRVRKKDGTVIWMETSSHPYFNDKGEMIGFQTSARDITRRKEIELKLEERERLYRLLSENTHDLIAIHDPDGAYTFVSSSFKNILGYELQELIGRSAYSIISPDDHERLRHSAHVPTLEGTSLSGVEYRIRKKDGSYIWVETYTQPIPDEKGTIVSIQTSSRDISQRKSYELELQLAKTKAEEANSAKSQFLSMMSHEIRTPMNAVIGLTNFMMEDEPSKRQLENLKLLKYSGENLLAIINEILDFNKIEAGKMELEAAPFDLIELLETIIKIMQPRATARNLDLLLDIDADLPRNFIGDSVRMNQILINLVSNAIKFTQHGSVELAVCTEAKSNDQYTLSFSVKDTGIGIDPDKQEIIFENFSQANKNITRKFGGTGLGLAISRKLVALMGGDLRVNSTVGKGSTFAFSITLVQSSEGPESKEPPLMITDADLDKTFNVLVVEDNPVNQVVVNNYLTKWGLQVSFAINGKEALQELIGQSFHLVLMDLQMPEMDGHEATRRIRSIGGSYYKKVPVIALTATATTDFLDDIKASGFNDVITKPFRPDDLQQKIFRHLRSSPLPAVTRASTDDKVKSSVDLSKNKNLKHLMADNLKEMVDILKANDDEGPCPSFENIVHKTKTTVSFIDDAVFSSTIEEMNAILAQHHSLNESEKNKKSALIALCNKKIEELSS